MNKLSSSSSKLVAEFDVGKRKLLAEWKLKLAGKGITVKERIQFLVEKDFKTDLNTLEEMEIDG